MINRRNRRPIIGSSIASVICAILGSCFEDGITKRGTLATQSCTVDTDCPGEAVCENGSCRGAAASCRVDADCPGEEICEQGACVQTDVSAHLAGSIGRCVETEIYSGYKSCIMDAPQVPPFPTENQVRQELNGNLPAVVDHRYEYITANCPPAHDQGGCGWCVAHAVTTSMEALECKVSKMERQERISEPHLWWLGRWDVNNCRGGWYVTDALNAVRKNKIVPSSVWPYDDNAAAMLERIPTLLQLRQLGKYSVAHVGKVSPGNVTELKAALSQGFNVVYGFPLFCDTGWLETNSQGARDEHYGLTIVAPPSGSRYTTPCTSGGQDVFAGCKATGKPYCQIGNHTVLIFGYDDTKNVFQLRNSWGVEWGDGNGDSLISQEYIRRFGQGGSYPRECEKNVAAVCADGDLYWRDSCFQKGDLKQDCTEYERCENVQCVSICTARAAVICNNGDVYSQDSCGRLEAMVQDCASAERCIGGRCVPPECTPRIRYLCQDERTVIRDDGCGNRGAERTCASSQYCQEGACVERGCSVTSSMLACRNGDVYQVDNCGNQSMVRDCTSSQRCENGQCVTNCTPNASRTCYNGDAYNVDSCGTRGSLVDDCTSSERCSNGQCVSTCTPNASRTCYNGDAYNVDSCGTRGSLADDCTSSERCENGQCVSTCTPNASRTCYNGDAYNVDSCGTRGSLADDCTSSETCQDGTCVSARCTNTSDTWVDGSLCWQKNPRGSERIYQPEATSYCDELTYAGFSDWRTPTIRELRTLVRGCPAIEPGGACPVYSGSDIDWDGECTNTGCDTGGGPGAGGCYMTTSVNGPCMGYWSSSTGRGSAAGGDGAWYISLNNGRIGWGLTTYEVATARCVRDNR